MRKILRPFVFLLAMGAMLLGACAAPAGSGTGSGTIKVYVTDAPPKGVTAVVIKASNVQVHASGAADDLWVTVLTDPPAFDLVKASGVNVLLGTSNITSGNYTQVRLDITDVTLTVNGQQVKATVPSDKLKLVGNVQIVEGKQTSVSIDFDAEKSVVEEGQGRWALKPVVKLIVGQPGATLASPTATP